MKALTSRTKLLEYDLIRKGLKRRSFLEVIYYGIVVAVVENR